MQELYYISGKTEKIYFPLTVDKIHLRWIMKDDLDEICEIEKKCFEFPWMKEDFSRCLQKRNCIGMVAEYRGKIVGFMIYELLKHRINLLNIAVSKEYQRRSFGSQLIERLVKKLLTTSRSRIAFTVRERNLNAQIFFRSQGFRAVSILYNYYETISEDAYLMQLRLSSQMKIQMSLKEFNSHLDRIKKNDPQDDEIHFYRDL